MDKKKVIVVERISDKGVEMLKAQPDLEVTVKFDIPREELLKIVGDYNAIIVRSVTKVNEEFYQAARNLKVGGPRRQRGGRTSISKGPPNGGSIVVNTRKPM